MADSVHRVFNTDKVPQTSQVPRETFTTRIHQTSHTHQASQISSTYSGIHRKDYPVIQIQKYKTSGNIQRLYYSFSSYDKLEQWVRSKAHTSFFEVIDNGDQKFTLDLESTDTTREEWERKVPILIDITRAMTGSKKYVRFESIDKANWKQISDKRWEYISLKNITDKFILLDSEQ